MGWRIAGGVLVVLSVLAGLLTVWSWLGRQTETQQQTYQRPVTAVEFDVDGAITLDAGTDGDLSFVRELTWSAGMPQITETWDGTVLRVSARCEDTRRLPGCSVAYRATVPPDVDVTAHSYSNGVTARDLSGDLSIIAEGGDVDLAELRGRVSVSVDTGVIRSRALRAPTVDAHADSGDVELRFIDVPTDVTVEAGSGDVTVEVPGDDAYSVQAESDAGGRDIEVRDDPGAPRSLRVHAGSGDIVLAYVGP